jgi:hypothetical protein
MLAYVSWFQRETLPESLPGMRNHVRRILGQRWRMYRGKGELNVGVGGSKQWMEREGEGRGGGAQTQPPRFVWATLKVGGVQVKKKAALCMLRLFRKYPDAFGEDGIGGNNEVCAFAREEDTVVCGVRSPACGFCSLLSSLGCWSMQVCKCAPAAASVPMHSGLLMGHPGCGLLSPHSIAELGPGMLGSLPILCLAGYLSPGGG